jgi:hypothetical protein
VIRKYSCLGGAALGLLAFMSVSSVGVRHAAADTNILDRIQEKAKLRQQVIDLIKSKDPGIALAAFEEAANDDDPELRLDAFDVAFASEDPKLRKSALRHFLDGRSELRIDVVLPDRPDKGQQYLYDTYHGYRFKTLAIDPKSDILSFDKAANRDWSGQLVEDGFDLSLDTLTSTYGRLLCVMTVRIADAQKLTGHVDCNFKGDELLQQTGKVTHAIIPVVITMS